MSALLLISLTYEKACAITNILLFKKIPKFTTHLLILLFYKNDRRPGILCLINDTDWELEGKGDYVL